MVAIYKLTEWEIKRAIANYINSAYDVNIDTKKVLLGVKVMDNPDPAKDTKEYYAEAEGEPV